MLYTCDRRFRVWDYTVSHDQVLLRSPGTPESPRNIDIIFLGVEYLGIPSMFNGLGLDLASPECSAEVMKRFDVDYESASVYTLVSGGHRHHLVAVAFRVYENDLELFESSLEYFSDKNLSGQAGDLLVHSGVTRQVG